MSFLDKIKSFFSGGGDNTAETGSAMPGNVITDDPGTYGSGVTTAPADLTGTPTGEPPTVSTDPHAHDEEDRGAV